MSYRFQWQHYIVLKSIRFEETSFLVNAFVMPMALCYTVPRMRRYIQYCLIVQLKLKITIIQKKYKAFSR